MMHANDTESDGGHRVGVEEQFIKFRPSPNFKNMKYKILKSKKSYDDGVDDTSPSTSEEAADQEPVKTPVDSDSSKPAVQAPIPIEQPPLPQEQTLQDTPKLNIPDNGTKEPNVKPKETCRDFLKGNCMRSYCRFAHVFKKEEIQESLTFCIDYQNKGCTYKSCKFAHANVFEIGHFRRTGYLPPRALAHVRKIVVPPPPPPPEDPAPAPAPRQPAGFNPPPALQAIAEAETRPVPGSSVTIKNTWIKDGVTPANDLDILQYPVVKKCQECVNKDFRLQYHKEKISNMRLASQVLKDKIAAVDNKTQRLATFVIFLDHVLKHPPN